MFVVDGGVLNECDAEEDEFGDDDDDDDDEDDSDSDDSEREFRTEFKKYKAHYYTDKLDFQHVTPWVDVIDCCCCCSVFHVTY